jgi:hypothetical protein
MYISLKEEGAQANDPMKNFKWMSNQRKSLKCRDTNVKWVINMQKIEISLKVKMKWLEWKK